MHLLKSNGIIKLSLFFGFTSLSPLRVKNWLFFKIIISLCQTVTIKEIKDAIRKLPTGKVLGLDRILNKAIKAVLKALITLLANTIIICLFKGKLPECCKVTTIIIL